MMAESDDYPHHPSTMECSCGYRKLDSEVSAFADSTADYLASRTEPWADETVMREAVSEVFRVIFGDQGAFIELRRLVTCTAGRKQTSENES